MNLIELYIFLEDNRLDNVFVDYIEKASPRY